MKKLLSSNISSVFVLVKMKFLEKLEELPMFHVVCFLKYKCLFLLLPFLLSLNLLANPEGFWNVQEYASPNQNNFVEDKTEAETIFKNLTFGDCRKNSHDPWEPIVGVPFGPFVGACLRSEQRRNFVAIELENDFITVANVSHADEFYMAQIPIKSLRRLVYQIEKFDPKWIAAHTQLRFDFSRPIKLVKQNGQKDSQPEYTYSLVFSVEAVPMRGGPSYDLFKGLKSYYALSYRLTSLEQKHLDLVIREKSEIHQYRLSTSQSESQNIFRYIIQNYSAKTKTAEYEEMYHTINRNCTNVLFEIFDQLASRNRGLFHRATTALPIISSWTLRLRNLIEKELSQNRLTNFESEF
jgi:hypothetical protein